MANHFIGHHNSGIPWNRDHMQFLCGGIEADQHIDIGTETVLIGPQNRHIDHFFDLFLIGCGNHKVRLLCFTLPHIHLHPDFCRRIGTHKDQNQPDDQQNRSASSLFLLCLSSGHPSALSHPSGVNISLLISDDPLSFFRIRYAGLSAAHLTLTQFHIHIIGRSAASSVFSFFTHNMYSPSI